jgi:predicted O-methyltransferase YrrM
MGTVLWRRGWQPRCDHCGLHRCDRGKNDPPHWLAIALSNRGFAFKAKGEFDRALQDYDLSLMLDPYATNHYNNRGIIYRIKGDLRRAIQEYEKAIALTVLRSSKLDSLLSSLHATSDKQLLTIKADYQNLQDAGIKPDEGQFKEYMSNKLVALDRDKAEFCYQLCRAISARRIVEAGTSLGVSTIYLAAALRDNIVAVGGSGTVIATEYEPAKARAARTLFQQAGLDELIDLREGDLQDTVTRIDGPIDFMLVDIWIDMARPALELVAPHLRDGAIVICDNTEQYRSEYCSYFDFINDPANRFRTMTLPFKGGLEMSIRC